MTTRNVRPELDIVPALPDLTRRSSEIVRVFDRMRRDLDHDDEYAEFCWFAREYPRCYRFHLNAAEFRLSSIHRLMLLICTDLLKLGGSRDEFDVGIFDGRVEQVYWDFESMLSEIGIALDLLARVVGPAFKQHTPPSFSKLCKSKEDNPLLAKFRAAQTAWIARLKDYRDCFVHYTPVDTLVTVGLLRRAGVTSIRAKLPTNPNAREILRFRYSRRVELLRYAIRSYLNLRRLDYGTAKIVKRLYVAGAFPARRDHLFFIGERVRPRADSSSREPGGDDSAGENAG